MSTSVLIDGTTKHVELICDSVELTQDNRDSRAQIESLLRDSPVDRSEIDSLKEEIREAKDRIYAAVLSPDSSAVSAEASYASDLERRLQDEEDYISERKRQRLQDIIDVITSYFADQYGITQGEYFVSDLNPDLLVETDDRYIPFLYGPEAGQFLTTMVKRSCEKLDLNPEYGDETTMSSVMKQVPLPFYGSKPESLQALWDFLVSRIGDGATIGVSGVFAQVYENPYLLLVGLGGAYVIRFFTPHAKTLQKETNEWFEDWAKEKLKRGRGRGSDEDDD